MKKQGEIVFGGGCHWCTEAVFQSLKGVLKVDQGYISSTGESTSFSEAVILEYDPDIIPLEVLIEIHLHTHQSTSNHSFRAKYRSAIYYFDNETRQASLSILEQLQKDFSKKIITQVLPFREFKFSEEVFRNYYFRDPERPFCRRYIHPKLEFLKKKYSSVVTIPS